MKRKFNSKDIVFFIFVLFSIVFSGMPIIVSFWYSNFWYILLYVVWFSISKYIVVLLYTFLNEMNFI